MGWRQGLFSITAQLCTARTIGILLVGTPSFSPRTCSNTYDSRAFPHTMSPTRGSKSKDYWQRYFSSACSLALKFALVCITSRLLAPHVLLCGLPPTLWQVSKSALENNDDPLELLLGTPFAVFRNTCKPHLVLNRLAWQICPPGAVWAQGRHARDHVVVNNLVDGPDRLEDWQWEQCLELVLFVAAHISEGIHRISPPMP